MFREYFFDVQYRLSDRLAVAQKGGKGKRIGLYGFGAAAHIIAQICAWQGREDYAFTRPAGVI